MAKVLYPTFYDEETKIWSGMKRRPYYDPDCSAGEVLFTCMKNWPNQIVQINDVDGREVTNGEMSLWATRLAIYFKKEKLTHEDVIGIIAPSSTYVAPVALACFFNTTPFHAVNSTKDANVVKSLYVVTKPKIMFCDGSDYERIKEVTQEWAPKIIILTGRIEGVTNVEDLLHPTPEEKFYQPTSLAVNGDQTAAILCSSGTSGLPKAVALSHRNITKANPFCKSTDIIITPATIDWATGFIGFTVSLLYGIPKVIFDGKYDADKYLTLIKKYNATTIIMAPWQAYELFTSPLATEENLSSVKMVFITGGWISHKVLQHAQTLMKEAFILFAYGATECGGVTANINHDLDNSVGRLIPGVRIRIADEHGNNLPHNEVGEILIETSSKWSGYVDNPVDTAATVQNGWINLGDLGYFDKDNQLYIVDRKKDLLKYKSMHYWPNEIEQIISELPEVNNVCVFGVRDTRYGDAAGALVIKKPGTDITEQQIIDHVAKRVVVEYKQLHSGVQFTDVLPQNANGKVMRSLSREAFEARMN